MPIALPKLDDRTYAQLMDEAVGSIPQYTSEWTHFNATEPGMVLLELLAWITETTLYRLDQIPDRHLYRYLELAGIEPATTRVELTFEATAAGGTEIGRGTRVASSSDPSIVFETLRTVAIGADGLVDRRQRIWRVTVEAVRIVDLVDSSIGTSDGTPHQLFPLQAPVLVDLDDTVFGGNPAVTVNGQAWSLHRALRGAGDVDAYTVDRLASEVRFGDGGDSGRVPPAGAEVRCTYRRLAENSKPVQAGELTELITLAGTATVNSVTNAEAPRGEEVAEALPELLLRALQTVRERRRAATLADFEELSLGAAGDDVTRACAVVDHHLGLRAPDADESFNRWKGHVSVSLLPAAGFAGTTTLDEALASPELADLVDAVQADLELRRILATPVHVTGVPLVAVQIQADVVAELGYDAVELAAELVQSIQALLDPYTGHDGDGWPFGRDVQRAELYQTLEAHPGVDYVEKLTLNGSSRAHSIALPDGSLPDAVGHAGTSPVVVEVVA